MCKSRVWFSNVFTHFLLFFNNVHIFRTFFSKQFSQGINVASWISLSILNATVFSLFSIIKEETFQNTVVISNLHFNHQVLYLRKCVTRFFTTFNSFYIELFSEV